MSAPGANPPARAPATDPEEATHRFWRGLASWVEPRAALWGFASALVVLALVASAESGPLERALRAANLAERGIDVFQESSSGAYLLKDELSAAGEPERPEVALLGASLMAATGEPDPRRRLGPALSQALRSRSGRSWRVVDLASDGYDNWSSFFIARLLRLGRRPDVLVVGLDAFEPTGANGDLILAAGTHLREFSSAELLPALAFNRQPLYRGEAAATAWFNARLPFLEVLRRARPRGLLFGAVSLARRGFRPAAPPRPVSWERSPGVKALIAAIAAQGPVSPRIGATGLRSLDLLGAELARCRLAGIRVLVVTLPKNPVLAWNFAATDRALDEWAARYHLELDTYWDSAPVPTSHFVDNSHFDGEGARIMAGILAGRILEGARP